MLLRRHTPAANDGKGGRRFVIQATWPSSALSKRGAILLGLAGRVIAVWISPFSQSSWRPRGSPMELLGDEQRDLPEGSHSWDFILGP